MEIAANPGSGDVSKPRFLRVKIFAQKFGFAWSSLTGFICFLPFSFSHLEAGLEGARGGGFDWVKKEVVVFPGSSLGKGMLVSLEKKKKKIVVVGTTLG